MQNNLRIELMQWQAHRLRGSLVDSKKIFLGRQKETWRIRQNCNPSVAMYPNPLVQFILLYFPTSIY